MRFITSLAALAILSSSAAATAPFGSSPFRANHFGRSVVHATAKLRAGDITIRGGAATRAEGDADKGIPEATDEIAKNLQNRNHTNLQRKFTHAGFGILFACLNQFLPHEQFVSGMAILTSVTLLMELLRYRQGFRWMNQVLHFFLGGTLRKNEMEGGFTGSFYYFSGLRSAPVSFRRLRARWAFASWPWRIHRPRSSAGEPATFTGVGLKTAWAALDETKAS